MRAVLIATGVLAAMVAGCEAGKEAEVTRFVEIAESLLVEAKRSVQTEQFVAANRLLTKADSLLTEAERLLAEAERSVEADSLRAAVNRGFREADSLRTVAQSDDMALDRLCRGRFERTRGEWFMVGGRSGERVSLREIARVSMEAAGWLQRLEELHNETGLSEVAGQELVASFYGLNLGVNLCEGRER